MLHLLLFDRKISETQKGTEGKKRTFYSCLSESPFPVNFFMAL